MSWLSTDENCLTLKKENKSKNPFRKIGVKLGRRSAKKVSVDNFVTSESEDDEENTNDIKNHPTDKRFRKRVDFDWVRRRLSKVSVDDTNNFFKDNDTPSQSKR